MSERRIVVGSDHGGVDLKVGLVELLGEWGWEVVDLGCRPGETTDYPDVALEAAGRVARGEAPLGLLVCGTGIGMCITANKVRGVRAALCHEAYSSAMARRHNDANVLCLGGRVVGLELAKAVLAAFLDASFEGGRHQRRLDKVRAIERGSGGA
jgi:ribose 5-phosphate isomerase B